MATLPKLTFCMTIGLDALSLWISSFHTNNASMLSRGEMDVTGARRVLNLLDRFNIKSTFLVPGHTALAYPNLIKEIRDRGHEFAYHGWMHEDSRDFDVAGQPSSSNGGWRLCTSLPACARAAMCLPRGT